MAAFERDLLIERTQAGLARAKAEGKAVGRKAEMAPEQQAECLKLREQGASLSEMAKRYGVSRAAIQRVHKRAAENARGAVTKLLERPGA